MHDRFDDFVLPLRCPCGRDETLATVAELARSPVEVSCGTCGGTYVVDAREAARRVVDEFRHHMAAVATDPVTIRPTPRVS